MDMTFTPEQIAFREEVRAWIREAMPPEMRRRAENGANFEQSEILEWHKILYEKGWIAPHWPKEVGGTGWDITERFLFQEECVDANAPQLSPFGLSMVGPLLIQFGSDEQKQRFLPKILSGEEVWCQGYSEPNAGSDLASLQTTRRQGRRRLRPERPEDLDHLRAVRRLDLPAGAARAVRAGSRKASPSCSPTSRTRRASRSSPSSPRAARYAFSETWFKRRACASGKPRRSRGRRLGHGEGAARSRAHGHRRRRRVRPHAPARQADRRRDDGGQGPAARRRSLPTAHRKAPDASSGRRHAEPSYPGRRPGRARTGLRELGPQDRRHRGAAGDDGALHGRHGPQRPRLAPRRRGRVAPQWVSGSIMLHIPTYSDSRGRGRVRRCLRPLAVVLPVLCSLPIVASRADSLFPDPELSDELRSAIAVQGNLERGRVAYEPCAGCHLPDGGGRADGSFPQLAGQHASVIVKQLLDIRAGRRQNPLMLPYAQRLAGSHEIADVALYLSSLPVPPENGRGAGTQLELGESLYVSGCADLPWGARSRETQRSHHPRPGGSTLRLHAAPDPGHRCRAQTQCAPGDGGSCCGPTPTLNSRP